MQAQLEPLGGALQLTELRSVLDVVVEQAVTGLRDLAAQLPNKADDERKRALLQYLHATRQRLLRLHVLAQWGNMAPAAAAVSRVLDAASRQAAAARDAADQLAMAHAHITAVQAPIHDVPTAAEVLETGGYRLMPAAIEDLRPAAMPAPAERAAALRLMDQMLRTRLLQEALPAGLQVLRVRLGVATLAIPHLFEARLTLVPSPDEAAVLARCGAFSGAAPSPAPSGGTVQPKAPADGAQPAGQAPAVVRAEAGAELKLEPATGSPPPQQAADAPASMELGPDAAGNAAPEPSQQPPEQQRHERWRWRLLSFTILPAFKGRPAVASASAAALQAQLEARMWVAADAAVLAAAGAVRAASAAQPSASAQPSGSQQQRSGTPAATPPAADAKQEPGTPAGAVGTPPPGTAQSGGGGAQAGGARDGGSSHELPTPLSLMTAVLKGVAARILVQEAVASLRKLAAPEGSWHGSLRISEPRILKIGARATYWTGNPPAVSAAQLATEAADRPVITAAPTPHSAPAVTPSAAQPAASVAIELGIDAAGDIRIVADPPLHHPSADPLPAGAVGQPSQTAQPALPAVGSAAGPSDATPAEGTPAAALPAPTTAAPSEPPPREAGSGGAISPAGAVAEGLWLDPTSGDASAPLLAAARATAALQLAALQQALQAAGGLAGAGGAAVLRSDRASSADASDGQHQDGDTATAAGAADGEQHQLGTLSSGGLATSGDSGGWQRRSDAGSNAETVLDLRCGGATVLTVGVAARTGRLTLRLGPGAADESALDQGAFTKQEEDTLARHQREAAGRAAASKDAAAPHPAAAAVGAAAKRLAALFGALEARRRLRGLVTAARALGLRESTLPFRLLQAYADSHRGAALPPQRFAVLAFPPTPPLAGFPAPPAPPQQQPAKVPPAAAAQRQPLTLAAGRGSGRSLCFCLLAAPAQQQQVKADPAAAAEAAPSATTAAAAAAPTAGGSWGFWLAAVRASPHGVPQQVLQLARIPQQQLTPAVSAPAASAAATAASQEPDRAPTSASKRKRPREADSVGTGADTDARPAKLPREAANGLKPAAPMANGPTGCPEATSGEAAANGVLRVPHAALANGHVRAAAAADSPTTSGTVGSVSRQPAAAAAAAGNPVSAALALAVQWCRSRLIWTTLLLQLQALGTPFSEQLTLGPPGGAQLDSSAAAAAASSRPVRSLRLRGFGALAALDTAAKQPAAQRQRQQEAEAAGAPAAVAGGTEGGRVAGTVAPTERPGLVLLPGSLAGDGSGSVADSGGAADGGTGDDSGGSGDIGAFRSVLCSSYLASLPAGSGDGSDDGSCASEGSGAVTRVEGGLSIAYSLATGDTVLTAAMDALRIARLHTFLQRLRRLFAASHAAPTAKGAAAAAGTPADSVAEAEPDRRSSFLLPGCGEVQLVRASPLQAVLVARPAAFAGSVAASAAAAADAADAAAAAAGNSAPAAAEGQPAHELHVTIEWLRTDQAGTGGPAAQQAGRRADRDASAAAAIRCSVSAVVAVPPAAAAAAGLASPATQSAAAAVPGAWCDVLAEMAEAGEEALLLRGLAVAGPQLAAAAAAIGPDALAAAGWLRNQVTVQAARPPYSVQLLLQKSPQSACRLDVRFAAGQLTWVSAGPAVAAADAAAASPATALQMPKQEGVPQPQQPEAGAVLPAAPATVQGAAPAPGAAAAGLGFRGDLGLPQLFAQLATQHAAVSLPAAAAAAAAEGGMAAASAPPGVWVHGGGALQTVIAAVMAHLSQQLL